ncbi:MAG TPA: phosphatidate cytidylyltransferase [Candidatus Omnitrophota bacterium]|nr:phosphatidate cytidylyltransferase [Candidatus Omnitrophota bacterium]
MLKHRILSTIIWAGVIYLAIRYKIAFVFAVIFLIAAGLYEFFSLIEKKGIHIYKYFGMAMGIIIPLSIIFKFELTKSWELFFIVAALLCIFVLQLKRKDNSQAVVSISTTLFGILYVSWLFSFLIKLRQISPWYLFAIIFITKSSDIGAYLIGSRFGRRHLLPRISPKKTVEGSVGGLLFSILTAMACKPIFGLSFPHLALIGAGVGILAELGDLSESLIKRDCQVKDSGNLFPGLGGVLDIIDSLLFTAPAFYFYMSNVLVK